MCWTLTRQAVVYENIVANNKIVVNKKIEYWLNRLEIYSLDLKTLKYISLKLPPYLTKVTTIYYNLYYNSCHNYILPNSTFLRKLVFLFCWLEKD